MGFVSHCVKSWGKVRNHIFTKMPIKSTKTHFFRIFSTFVFRCMVNSPELEVKSNLS